MERGRQRAVRLAALAVILIALIAVGTRPGVRGYFTVEGLRAAATAAGPLGVGVYVAAFCVGELLYVPGIVFLVAAVLAWGRGAGGAIGFVAGLMSLALSFALVRWAGGQALGESKRPWLRGVMARLDAHPVRSVVVLRLLFQLSPALNYALALSSIRLRDYLLGSACGLLVPVAVVALFTEQVARYLAR